MESNYLLLICSLILQEKAPYINKAEKRKTEYNKSMQAYNKRLVCPIILFSFSMSLLHNH